MHRMDWGIEELERVIAPVTSSTNTGSSGGGGGGVAITPDG